MESNLSHSAAYLKNENTNLKRAREVCDIAYICGDCVQEAAVRHITVEPRHRLGECHRSGWILDELEMLTFHFFIHWDREWTCEHQ